MLAVLTSEELKSTVDLGVVLADPGCIEAVVRQKFLINRNSVLFRVRLRGEGVPRWGRSDRRRAPFEPSPGPQAGLLTPSFLPPTPGYAQ